MSDTEHVAQLIRRIRPILAGQPSPVQGAVIADLLATWLVGHIDSSSKTRTEEMRRKLLKVSTAMVRELVSIYDTPIPERPV